MSVGCGFHQTHEADADSGRGYLKLYPFEELAAAPPLWPSLFLRGHRSSMVYTIFDKLYRKATPRASATKVLLLNVYSQTGASNFRT